MDSSRVSPSRCRSTTRSRTPGSETIGAHPSTYTPLAVLEQHDATRSSSPRERMTDFGYWIQLARTASYADLGLPAQVTAILIRPIGRMQDIASLILEYLRKVRAHCQNGERP